MKASAAGIGENGANTRMKLKQLYERTRKRLRGCRVLWLAGCVSLWLFACGRETVEEELSAVSAVESTEETAKEDAAAASTQETENAAAAQEAEESTDVLLVDVCGAVVNPGVYELPAGARLVEAIDMAGGFTAQAAVSYHNRARPLTDGEQIYVPTEEEVQTGAVSQSTAANASAGAGEAAGLVNINTATAEELTTLTGIGEAKAKAIIAYREANGGFSSKEELMQVEGIKEGTYNKLQDQITV